MRRGLLSEELAKLILEGLGYTIEKLRHKVVIEGNEVAEIDIIAIDPHGTRYGVEVKSGEISISDVRQAYVSARLANLKPMIMGKGFSNEASAKLAQELDVKVLLLPDYVMLTPEELCDVISKSVVSVIEEFFRPPPKLSDEEVRLLRALASSSSFTELSKRLNIDERTLGLLIRSLKNKGVLPKSLKGYDILRARAVISLLLHKLLYSNALER